MALVNGCHWQLAASAIFHSVPNNTLADKPPVAPGVDRKRGRTRRCLTPSRWRIDVCMALVNGCHWQLAASAIFHSVPNNTLADKPPVAPMHPV